jgi:ATP-binding cassette subfamily A (ABC1) protein 3
VCTHSIKVQTDYHASNLFFTTNLHALFCLRSKFQRQLGYCPQSDPLIEQMTVLETMFMFARLRGIKSKLIPKTCLSLIKLLDLSDHLYKMCYTLSGGNKRKLSVAVSLVGSPVIILLDEPTS